MTDLPRRIKREALTVEVMIRHYCKNRHDKTGRLCDNCRELLNYSLKRLSSCPYQGKKTTCGNCAIHCYKPKMREKIQEVMRVVGPRMLWTNPYLGIMHLIDDLKPKT